MVINKFILIHSCWFPFYRYYNSIFSPDSCQSSPRYRSRKNYSLFGCKWFDSCSCKICRFYCEILRLMGDRVSYDKPLRELKTECWNACTFKWASLVLYSSYLLHKNSFNISLTKPVSFISISFSIAFLRVEMFCAREPLNLLKL